MNGWIAFASLGTVLLLAATAAFFFACTRGALIVRAFSATRDAASHVYPIYSNMRLIKLVDWQPVISAILLFQYPRLVDRIVDGLRATDLTGKKVLITSCAFGNVIPRVVEAALEAGAEKVLIADIIRNELVHAEGKLQRFAGRIEYLQDNATDMHRPECEVDANIIFFLLHELPHELKTQCLREAGRVLAPGGTLYLAEFHRPRSLVLRVLSWTYFKVFEPLGLALWDRLDPVDCLRRMGGWKARRETFLDGNYQVITAVKA